MHHHLCTHVRPRTRYTTTLLQVRHPLATLASSVRAFCDGGRPLSTDGALLHAVRGFLPLSVGTAAGESCLVQFARFWLAYYTTALPHVHAWYRIEDTSACAVAELANMSYDRRRAACATSGASTSTSSSTSSQQLPAAAHGTSSLSVSSYARAHGRENRHNRDGFQLRWADIEQAAADGPILANNIRALARHFGYRDDLV